MIPFARISTYGNRPPPKPKVKSIQGGATRSSFAILYDNGELYGFYDNFYGQLGNGTRVNITDKFTLMNTDVKMFSMSDTGCVVLKNDGTIWHTGSKVVYTNESGTFNLVPTNISSYFSTINTASISKIAVLQGGITVMMNNGDVYGIGSNGLGQMGRSGAITSLTLLASGVLNFFGHHYNSGYITQNNDFYITGYNANGQLGTGDTTTGFSYAKLASNVNAVQICSQSTHIQYLDSSVKACGLSRTLGINVSTGNTLTLTSIVPALSLSFNNITVTASTATFGINSGTLYSTGDSNTSSLNVSTAKYTYNTTVTPLGIDFDGINVLQGATYMWKGTDIYYCGGTATDPNKGTSNVYAFQKVLNSLPYYS